MAISSYPTPVDAGVLFVILANTATSISIFKEIVLSFLHIIGIHFASWERFSEEPSQSPQYRKWPSESYMEDFRSCAPAIRYDSIFVCDGPEKECSICLSEFKPNSEIHNLSCGHVFHQPCLEKWLKYWNTTCPLCRNYITPQELEDDACPM